MFASHRGNLSENSSEEEITNLHITYQHETIYDLALNHLETGRCADVKTTSRREKRKKVI
ncbi:CLUMA_CG003093, isoform A [Clunio marinus]|uniref:CLUMA_CG003093, isoform A n=1 Tax=Clunio marinus TaxID=568069 RepID=A0A1J1HS83_9DIPT|nr:CLUMA_CG003093, isoform A [Clunio marinus]